MVIWAKHFNIIDSTQNESKKYQLNGKEALLITADQQLAGYGKADNKWASPPGNLAMSLQLKWDFANSYTAELTIIVAQIVCDLMPDLPIRIKHPNDLLVTNKKLAGILLEQWQESVIIGIGMNIMTAPEICNKETISLNQLQFNIQPSQMAAQITAKIITELDRLS